MNERQEAWTTFLINEQVKPGFTNYQPQDLAKTIWNFSSRLKNLENLQQMSKCKKHHFLREFKIGQNVVKTFKNANEFQKSSKPDK